MLICEAVVETGHFNVLDYLLPWVAPVLLLALVAIFRVRLAELAAEAVHVFRLRLHVLREGSPLTAASELAECLRDFIREYDCCLLASSGAGDDRFFPALCLLGQMRLEIVRAQSLLPERFAGDLLAVSSQIEQIQASADTPTALEDCEACLQKIRDAGGKKLLSSLENFLRMD